MARGNKYTCRVCGKTYDYCPACEFTPDPIREDGFCCKDHYDIFTVLSKHGCHLATTEETLAELDKFTIPADIRSEIQAHIDAIKAEVKPVVEAKSVKAEAPVEEPKPLVEEETPAEKATFFKKK